MVNLFVPPGHSHPLILDAASRPGGAAIKNSIYSGIVRYLSDGGSGLPGKLLLPNEAADILANDQALVSNWETYADRMKGGYPAGSQDARSAWAAHKSRGGPDGAVIYFSADWDVAPSEQDAINQYLQAAIDYLGVESVGVYGSYYVCKRVHEWNPAVYLWQTIAWSGGQMYPAVHLYQRNDWGYAHVGGAECDVNEVIQEDFGQWNLHFGAPAPAKPADPPVTKAPTAIELEYANNPWLGSKVTKVDEETCPDGVGKFVYYDDGAIYWHPKTGAHAIPNSLVEKYKAMGYETGPLGYPVDEQLTLKDGIAQAFQGGSLYQKASQPAQWVHGLIGDEWGSTQWEMGPLGYPVSDEIAWARGTYQNYEHGTIYYTTDSVVATDDNGVPVEGATK